jgi:hypothetical protein
MLVVQMNLVSGEGEEKVTTEIGRIEIANISGDRPLADYEATIHYIGTSSTFTRTILIKDFPRTQLSPYDLLHRALFHTLRPQRSQSSHENSEPYPKPKPKPEVRRLGTPKCLRKSSEK